MIFENTTMYRERACIDFIGLLYLIFIYMSDCYTSLYVSSIPFMKLDIEVVAWNRRHTKIGR